MARIDLEDMLGAPPKRRRGRPRKDPNGPEVVAPTDKVNDWDELEDGNDKFNSRDITPTYRGVTVNWLHDAFRMDKTTIKKKLARLEPISYQRGNTPLFDFVQAASYLVRPRVDLKEYIKTLRPEDLPNDLQKEYWDALLKRQKYMRQAGELWHTNDVIEVFGEAFKQIKTASQLWINQLDRTTGLTPTQLKTLESLVDQLLDDLHTRLTDMQNRKSTGSSAEDMAEDVPDA